MRIRKSFEQAICILLLIGTSEGPLKSHELSKMLDVSDSYLKKVWKIDCSFCLAAFIKVPSVKKASDDAFSLKIFQERVRSQMR